MSDATNVVVVSAADPVTVLTLQPAVGPALSSSTMVPIPDPLPLPSVPLGTGIAAAFHISGLSAATTYTVSATAFSGGCTTPVGYGSFTTQ